MKKIATIIKELEGLATKKIVIEGYDLGRIKEFMGFMGNPQDDYPVIHVTGTSGKGSTTAIITKILEYHGYKVGAYYSPHIVDPMERIQVNGKKIKLSDFVRLYQQVKANVLISFPKDTELKLTYFEFLLAMAFIYFKEQHVDCLVLEVGIGGRLDPTNIVKSEIAVITSIGLDHTKLLGNTVEKIASDKVQILKPNTVLITAAQKESVLKIMRDYVVKQNSQLLVYKKDFKTKIRNRTWSSYGFDYISATLSCKELEINLLGRHQVVNAALAITVASRFLKNRGLQIQDKKLRQALMQIWIPGRIQVISKQPIIILDTAHNGMKMRALAQTLDELISNGQRLNLLLAFKKGQQLKRLLQPLLILSPVLKKIIVTKFKVVQDIPQQSEESSQFLSYLNSHLPHCKVEYIGNPQKAYAKAISTLNQREILCVTGSFYLLNAVSNGNQLIAKKLNGYQV